MALEVKSLMINDILHGEYVIVKDTIFLKMIRKIMPDNDLASENMLIYIIQSIEGRKFERASYLNN